MTIIGQAEVEIVAKTDKFERQVKAAGTSGGVLGKFTGIVDKAEGALGKLGITSQQLAVVLGAGLAGGAAFAAREILQFAASSVKAAADLGEQINQSRVVFGDSSDDVEKFAKTAVDSFGLSERAALQAAGSFGAIGKSIGLSEGAVDDFSVSLVKIAGDIASFKNISTEEALQKLTSGLVGQTETLREIGIIIDQDTLKRAAQREGIVKGSQELSQQEKVLATYSEILLQSVDAQGDFARTSESLPNQLRSFGAQVENLKAKLGSGLLPAVVEVVGGISDFVFLIDKAARGIQDLVGAVPEGFSLTDILPGASAREFLGDIVDKIKGTDEESGKLATTSELLANGLRKAEQAAEDEAKELKKAADAANTLADANKRLDRARADGARRIKRAEEDVAEAQEERVERIAEAEEKLKEIRLSSARGVRDAREGLQDFERGAAQQEVEAQRQIVEARKQRTQAITDAQIALERAQASGDAEAENEARRALGQAQADKGLADTRRELAEQEKERELELSRLRRALAEERTDAADRVQDAIEEVAQVEEDTAERIKEAQRSVADARRESNQAIDDAIEGVRRLKEDTLDAFEKMGNAAAFYNKQLKMISENPVFQFSNSIYDKPYQGRAHGGPVSAGRPYLVGEDGPELVVPRRNADVVNNTDLVGAIRSAMGGQGNAFHFNIPHQDVRVLANEIAFRIAQEVSR